MTLKSGRNIDMTKEEFEHMYRQYYPQMYRLARTMVYDTDECKDIVSDIFARLLRGGIMPESDKMEGYLMMSVRNRCRDILKHKSVRERVENLFSHELAQSNIISINEDDRLERLMIYIETVLPPLSQQIFRLRFLREMTYEEVAQAIGVSKVTVYNHLSQSLQHIKDYFKNK
jgi:RNA polymerase sigma-70 factor (ECF subfamily)